MSAEASPRLLRRDPSRRWFGGVCAGLARRFGIDPALIRLAFVVATAAGGIGIALYALAWLVIPAGDAPGSRRRLPTGRGAVEVALGTGLLLLSVLLTFRGLGLWFSDAIVWPLVLIASGGALIWRGSASPSPTLAETPPASALLKPEAAERPVKAGAWAAAVSRTGIGIALVVAAGFAFLQATGALSAARDVVLAVLAAVVVLGVIFAPWWLRLVRSLTEERAERIRSQERAEVAAHLHDSVLQTLALVQRSDDPKEVAALARRQERELRAWLSGRPAAGQADRLAQAPGSAGRAARRLARALEAAAAEVEERHGVPVEVVMVGDRDLDPATDAVVAAAREAMTNAAKFGAGSTVDVYAESTPERLQIFVRDRGPGFDPEAVPPDRRGVRESIVGRMERHGGAAKITSNGATGTEVELELPARPHR